MSDNCARSFSIAPIGGQHHEHTTVFVGLDVHKDSITAACVDAQHDAPVIDLGTMGTQQYAIDRLLNKLSGRGRLKLVYEA